MDNAKLPAYPVKIDESIDETFDGTCDHDGLTKRERFAMAAMQGLIGGEDHTGWSKPKSEQAVYIADKTLEVLEES